MLLTSTESAVIVIRNPGFEIERTVLYWNLCRDTGSFSRGVTSLDLPHDLPEPTKAHKERGQPQALSQQVPGLLLQ